MIVVLKTFQEAMRLPEEKQWKAASDKEMESLPSNFVFTLVPMTAIPAGRKAIGFWWAYKVKFDTVYKGRFVVQG